MAEQTYIYQGPTSGFTLVQEDGAEREVMLYDGAAVTLPAEHPHVQTLVAQRFLQEAPGAELPEEPAREPEPTRPSNRRSTKEES